MQTILTIPKATVEVEEQKLEIVRVIIEVDRLNPEKGEVHLIASTATDKPLFMVGPVAELVEACTKAFANSLEGATVETIENTEEKIAEEETA